jgi:hypothetical protein
MMRSARVALTVGLALTAAALGVVLSRSPITVAGTNSSPAHHAIAYVAGGSSGCQEGGTLPRGTSAIRISAAANTGPRVTVTALSGSLVLARGTRDAGWAFNETVTVPVKRVSRTIPNAVICIAFGPAIEPIQINGTVVRRTAANGSASRTVNFRVEYLRAGHESWWSLASSVARHMGLGHAASGTWIVFFLIALMITVATLASRLVLRELR